MGRAGRLAACALLAGLAASPAGGAEANRFEVYAGAWRASAGGAARIDGAEPGSSFEIEGDAGAGGTATAFDAGLWFHPRGRHRLRFEALDLSTSGTATLGRSVSLGGPVLPPGTAVSSSYDLRLVAAHYAWAFVNLDVVVVSLLAGIDGLDARTEIRSLEGDGLGGASGGAPVIGIAAQVEPVEFVRVFGEASYGPWGAGGIERIRDLSVRGEFYVTRLFGLGLGYRDLEVRADDPGDGAVDSIQRGFQAFLLFRF